MAIPDLLLVECEGLTDAEVAQTVKVRAAAAGIPLDSLAPPLDFRGMGVREAARTVLDRAGISPTVPAMLRLKELEADGYNATDVARQWAEAVTALKSPAYVLLRLLDLAIAKSADKRIPLTITVRNGEHERPLTAQVCPFTEGFTPPELARICQVMTRLPTVDVAFTYPTDRAEIRTFVDALVTTGWLPLPATARAIRRSLIDAAATAGWNRRQKRRLRAGRYWIRRTADTPAASVADYREWDAGIEAGYSSFGNTAN